MWTPHYEIHCNDIEKVKKKIVRFCAFKLNVNIDQVSYSDLRIILNVQTLNCRRKVFDLLFLFKIINFYINCPELLSLLNIHVPQRSNRNFNLFYTNHHRTNLSLIHI